MNGHVWILRSLALFVLIVTGLALQVAKHPGRSFAVVSGVVAMPASR